MLCVEMMCLCLKIICVSMLKLCWDYMICVSIKGGHSAGGEWSAGNTSYALAFPLTCMGGTAGLAPTWSAGSSSYALAFPFTYMGGVAGLAPT